MTGREVCNFVGGGVQVTSYPDGKLVVEVLRDKFDGDSICVQCRERDNSWDRSGWVRITLFFFFITGVTRK